MEKKILEKVLSHDEFKLNPPVLFDIGGSGGIHNAFKAIEKFSIVICVDADNRDFNNESNKNRISINKIISSEENNRTDFYLTKSPHCSSTLKPLNDSLIEYSFSKLFEISEKVSLESVTISKILLDNNISTIDWFKSDSKGTDLRLFNSIPEEIRNNIIVAEFEPGIIDAYTNEDKLHHTLSYMDNQKFWLDNANVRHSVRINIDFLNKYLPDEKINLYESVNKSSPAWCEVSFINKFETNTIKTKRNYLLGILFSIIKNQLAFALKLSYEANEIYNDQIFSYLIKQIDTIYKRKKSLSKFDKVKARIVNFIKRI